MRQNPPAGMLTRHARGPPAQMTMAAVAQQAEGEAWLRQNLLSDDGMFETCADGHGICGAVGGGGRGGAK